MEKVNKGQFKITCMAKVSYILWVLAWNTLLCSNRSFGHYFSKNKAGLVASIKEEKQLAHQRKEEMA
jgi:hypothetical protein